jgi:mannose-6-phosphate isomerase-like protein (cupin superfamily)
MTRLIDNPRSGERIVICQSGDDTDGQLLAFELFLQPGAHVPASHSHPRQEERFSVLDGSVRFRLGRDTFLARAGATVSVPEGTAHWFGNCGDRVAHLHVEVRPALRMEELLASSVRRATTSRPWWSRLIDLALIPLDFPTELRVPHLPARLVTVLLTPLAWLRPLLSA